jgi:hypothetical protein
MLECSVFAFMHMRVQEGAHAPHMSYHRVSCFFIDEVND